MKKHNQPLPKEYLIPTVALILMGIFIIADLSYDYAQDGYGPHFFGELIILALCFIGVVFLVRALLIKKREIESLQTKLQTDRQDLIHWKNESKKYIDGLSQVIDQQFNSWLLSPGEKDIAMLLLKGLTTREIASIRNTKEKTIRQQATSIYKKANISGRQELAAFFLEDLLSPTNDLLV
ncbi:MAG: hypothetical protein HN353_08120 [Bdellovibrionales bacterium]|jgi:DNA-binding CsgD family transcriptional regulator|nr:hypothetical protein [Bdellovibrionales bacterium]MBT3525886.1 hypothetical protein [Bdellovibrionales bacterium]MBT7669853.1 hypothetical protein [Bdellovibrionales bacterium]MBT7766122.1 hypothetical protein [Bdellovibrionales bacterium]